MHCSQAPAAIHVAPTSRGVCGCITSFLVHATDRAWRITVRCTTFPKPTISLRTAAL